MRTDPKPTEISIDRRAVSVTEIPMVSGSEQRIGPRPTSGYRRGRQQPPVQRQAAVEAPGTAPDTSIEKLIRELDSAVQEHRRSGIDHRVSPTAAEQHVPGGNTGFCRSMN